MASALPSAVGSAVTTPVHSRRPSLAPPGVLDVEDWAKDIPHATVDARGVIVVTEQPPSSQPQRSPRTSPIRQPAKPHLVTVRPLTIPVSLASTSSVVDSGVEVGTILSPIYSGNHSTSNRSVGLGGVFAAARQPAAPATSPQAPAPASSPESTRRRIRFQDNLEV